MNENTPATITGACLCGSVSLGLTPDREVVACHCTQCRKQTGHFVAATRVPDEHLSITGEHNLTWYESSEAAKRAFCKTCGSVLLWKANDSHTTSVMAGCLDAPTGLKIDRHIYTEDKGDYYEIASSEKQI